MAAVTFEELVAGGEPFDVARGAALLSRDEYPKLDVDALLASLDDLAAPLVGTDLARLPAQAQAEALRVHLYEERGYRGNEDDYYDPKNSLLSDVLARRVGIPISLALVVTEVATRAGVRARGVAFPGHFLVRIDDASGGVAIVDPFFGGKTLGETDLEALLKRVSGQASPEAAKVTTMSAALLEPAPARAVLLRWLMNLRGVYLQRGDYPRALVVMDRVVTLAPQDASALRDRGLLAARLGALGQARADLASAVRLAKDPELLERTKSDLARLERKRSNLN